MPRTKKPRARARGAVPAPPGPRARAREKARDILRSQREAGLATLSAPWAQAALAEVREHCPNVTTDQAIRLFAGRSASSAETVLQAALFLEWNGRPRGRAARGRSREAAAAASD